jgi:hypothetical protein
MQWLFVKLNQLGRVWRGTYIDTVQGLFTCVVTPIIIPVHKDPPSYAGSRHISFDGSDCACNASRQCRRSILQRDCDLPHCARLLLQLHSSTYRMAKLSGQQEQNAPPNAEIFRHRASPVQSTACKLCCLRQSPATCNHVAYWNR